ncbi:MAG: hypothetical protein IT436_14500 [Phycisphaerales bacterium]|nr:hypothetical protein [Phycisphaerales bacterium]
MVPPESAPLKITLDQYTSQALTRMAVLDLRQQVVDLPRDYRITYRVLEEAQRLAPSDLELAHRLGEAAWRMEEEDAITATCRRILDLDPKDGVTVLRLITSRLNRTQTLDQRLEAYERFLGPEGNSIDTAVRSRLAMDSAQLRRELGDEKGFLEKVKLAAQLDPTNKEAAQEAAVYFSQRVPDPLGRMELIANLLYADPMDPTTQLWMAREMAAQGVFDQANRFHTLGRSLISRSGQQPDARIFIESLVLMWQDQGPQVPVQMLSDYVFMNRRNTERKVEEAELALQPTANMPRAKDIRLDIDMERVRVLAAMVHGDPDALSTLIEFKKTVDKGLAEGDNILDSAVGDFGASVAQLYDNLQNPEKLPRGMPIEDVRAEVRRLLLEAQMIRGMTNTHLDQVEFDQEKIDDLTPRPPEGQPPVEDAEQIVARGWVELRTSGPEKALETLLPLNDTVAAARFGVATCREMLGQKEQAAADFLSLAAADPMGVLGAAARTRFMKLTGRDEPLTGLTVKARDFGRSVPPSLDEMVLDPSSYMSINAEVSDPVATALQPVRVHLRIRNISSFPLSVGAGLTVDTRFLFAPNLIVSSESAQRFVQPEVVGLDRRLRLMPGEAIEADVWGDVGETGWMAEAAASELVRLRWRVLQGFQTGMAGVFEPGIGCLSTMTNTVTRFPLYEAIMPVEQLTARIATDPEDRLPALAVATRCHMVGVGRAGSITGEPREALARAWAARYPSCSPTARMMILATLPHGGISPEMEVLGDVARQEADPRVGVIVAVAVCRAADDPFLKAAAASSDDALREVAVLQAARLGEVEMTYSRNGPGLRGRLSGSSEPKVPLP